MSRTGDCGRRRRCGASLAIPWVIVFDRGRGSVVIGSAWKEIKGGNKKGKGGIWQEEGAIGKGRGKLEEGARQFITLNGKDGLDVKKVRDLSRQSRIPQKN